MSCGENIREREGERVRVVVGVVVASKNIFQSIIALNN